MNITPNWGTAPAFNGSVERLPAGGYVCRILKAWCETTANGSEQLVMALDIMEGKYAGYFNQLYTSRKKADANAKWPCLYKQFTLDTEGQTNPWFKGLIKAIEESNVGYVWNWLEETLKGKAVGIVFREEEFEANDGSIRTTVRPAFARSAQRVREGVEAPAIRRLNKNTSHSQNAPGGSFAAQTNMRDAGFQQVYDEKLPWEV